MQTDTEKWSDLTEMTFGKWKGTVLQDVPAKYLHWFYCNCSIVKGKDSERLLNYIKDSLHALKTENSDLIWHREIKD